MSIGIIENLTLRKICIIILMWMAYTNICTSSTCEGLSRNPLEGSKQRWPADRTYGWNDSTLGAAKYSYNDEEGMLARLLDVGACSQASDIDISYVPPLDGASPVDTLCQDQYAMKFVLFDLQLVELKEVDPVGGSFRVELQIILHWMDSIIPRSDGIDYTDNCSFLCDTNSPRPLCCDNVWVPPLRLSSCEIHEIKSSTPTPNIVSMPREILSYKYCFKDENDPQCFWRRLWYLNIDATCGSNMDFHNFPFDVQSLTIDILNPYSSRTWFQLTKGFLQDNINEDINDVDLSPDRNILGWYVKDLRVSSSCGTSEGWKQTFLSEDRLLMGLNNNVDGYHSQHKEIINALSPQNLTCPNMEDFNNSKGDIDFTSAANFEELYMTVRNQYEERLHYTLEKYRQCIDNIENNGTIFSWSMSVHGDDDSSQIPEFGYFSTSTTNIKRSFNILDIEKDQNTSKVWFPCAISAVSNLTISGIQVTIIIERYQKFYVMKLLLPTVACVAFSFSAFGLHPEELVGRLTVVVPSAIALTALQALVVATDIPPVAYIAPSTYIFLFSYLVQLLISFESILVKCLSSQKSPNLKISWNASILRNSSTRRYERIEQVQRDVELSEQTRDSGPSIPTHDDTAPDGQTNAPAMSQTNAPAMNEPDGQTNAPAMSQTNAPAMNEPNGQTNAPDMKEPNGHLSASRKFDIIFMIFLATFYIMSILIFTILPLHRSAMSTRESSTSYVSLWPGSTD